MTVRELIEKLAEMPPDALVVLAKDAEGNDFSPVADDPEDVQMGVVEGWYEALSTWSGSFDWGNGVKTNAVCLWPIN